MLDVASAQKLVTVARSDVDLSRTSLNDATDRFRNGIDNDLPVVEAQSTLASAEAQLVNSLYEYNTAKLALARSLGIIDREYRAYLGKSCNWHSPTILRRSINRARSSSADAQMPHRMQRRRKDTNTDPRGPEYPSPESSHLEGHTRPVYASSIVMSSLPLLH